jgi:hypothetical protein
MVDLPVFPGFAKKNGHLSKNKDKVEASSRRPA